MPKKTKAKTVRKKAPRGYRHVTDEVKLRALACYYITGAVKVAAKEVEVHRKTICEWIRKHPEIVKKAKDIANDYLDQKCAELIHYSYQGIVEKIDTLGKRKEESLEALNRICGTMIDKLLTIRGFKTKHELTGKDGEPIEMNFTFGTANLKPQQEHKDENG